MKATHHYRSTGEQFCKMKIEFIVDANLIEYAVYECILHNVKLTRKNVEERIREILRTDGDTHYAYREREEAENNEAIRMAPELFPDFFTKFNA